MEHFLIENSISASEREKQNKKTKKNKKQKQNKTKKKKTTKNAYSCLKIQFSMEEYCGTDKEGIWW